MWEYISDMWHGARLTRRFNETFDKSLNARSGDGWRVKSIVKIGDGILVTFEREYDAARSAAEKVEKTQDDFRERHTI